MQAVVNDLDNGANILVLAANSNWTGDAFGRITFADNGITIRAPLSTDPNYATYGGKVTIGPPITAGYTANITNKSNIVLSGNISFVGHAAWGYATVAITGGCSNITIGRAYDLGTWQRPSISSAAYAGAYPLNIVKSTTVPSNILIDGVDISAALTTATTAVNIQNIDSGSGIEIKNCTILNTGIRAISPPDSSTISGTGISLIGNSAPVLAHDNTIGSSDNRWKYGIQVSNSSNQKVYKNAINYCWDGDTYPNQDGMGIWVLGTSTANHIYDNYILWASRGIQTTSSVGGNIYDHNIIVNATVNGIDVFGSANVTAEEIYYNTIIHRPFGTAINGHGMDVQSTGKTAIFKNNIIDSYTNVVGTSASCLDISNNGSDYSVFTDHNILHNTGTAHTARIDAIPYDTLSAYKAGIANNAKITGKDANSSMADPLFKSSADFHLQPGSLAINAGMDVCASLNNADDYDGHPQCRSGVWVGYSKPPIGAYEYRPKAVHR